MGLYYCKEGKTIPMSWSSKMDTIQVCTYAEFQAMSNEEKNKRGVYCISDMDYSIYCNNDPIWEPIKPKHYKKIRYTHCKSCGAPLKETYTDKIKCEYCDTIQDTYKYE